MREATNPKKYMTYDEVRARLREIATTAADVGTELCGFVASTPASGDRFWTIYPLSNMANKEMRSYYYLTDPAEQIVAFEEIQKRGEHLWGVYHTHTSAPGPSIMDVAHWKYPQELKMVIVTPEMITVFQYMGEEGLVTTLWPK